MKKYWIYIVILAIILIGIFAYFFFFRSNNNNQTPAPAEASRTTTDINVQSNTSNTVENTVTNITTSETQNTETEIAHFSTDILVDDDKRDNNLELTASKIDGTIVKDGEEFSFNKVVGNPTPDEGYEKAGIIVDGEKKKGYGGGNCQISTTIYDAVLKVKGLKVTERHEHGKDIGYVEEGKDATVVYDELDLKFKNKTGHDIKIYVDVTEKKVKVKIMKIS